MTGPDAPIGRPSTRTWAVVAAVVGMVAAATLLLWSLDVRAESGLPLGTHDFIQHSAAFDVAVDGGDPYDNATLRDAENDLYPRYTESAQRFWYPPWMLVVLAPVVALPFEVAAALWVVLTLVGAVGVTLLSWRLFRPGEGLPPPLIVGLGLVFAPLLECLILGQMGVLIALCTLGGLVALRERRDVLAGVLFALTMTRPQVVILLLLVVGIHVVATKRWAVVCASIATAACIIGASLVVFPSVWAGWDPVGGSPTHFRTPTISSMLRSLAAGDGVPAPEWPIVVVPVIAVLLTIPWAVHTRHAMRWDVVPFLLGVSVLAAPYAWVYDSMLLLPIHVLAVGCLVEPGRRRQALAFAAIALQIVALVVRSLPSTGHEALMIVPVGLLVLYAVLWQSDRSGSPQTEATADEAMV